MGCSFFRGDHFIHTNTATARRTARQSTAGKLFGEVLSVIKNTETATLRPATAIRAVEAGRNMSDIRKIPQLAFYMSGRSRVPDAMILHSTEECMADKRAFAENFHNIETAANMMHPPVIIEYQILFLEFS